MFEISKVLDYLSSKLEENDDGFLEFKYEEGSNLYKIKLVKKKLEKTIKTHQTIENKKNKNKPQEDKEIKSILSNKKEEIPKINNESEIYRESEDLGGFKIKFINEKKFFIFSTLVGTLKLDEEIEKEKVINPRQKIGEIEILNLKNPISLDFKYKILEIFTSNKEKVDYGKNIILGEKIEDGSNY